MSNTENVIRSENDNRRIHIIREKDKRNKFELNLLSVIGIVGFIFLWQIVVSTGIVSSNKVASPLQIYNLFLVKLVDPNPDGNVLSVNIIASLQIVLAGFFLAIGIGVPLGLFMGWYTGFDKFMRPIFEIIRPIPPVSWIPLTIVWLGIGLNAKAFIVFFSAFVPCVINTYTGIKQTSPVLINVTKTCGASNFTTFRKIGIPSALPMMFAGIRVALGNAWATLVAAEMLAASAGLGYMILMGRQFARADLIILGIVVIGIIGVILTFVLEKVERRILKWRY